MSSFVRFVYEVAQQRWLTKEEIISVLTCHDLHGFPLTGINPVSPPPSGTLLLYDKAANKFWRNDGHAWKRKADHHEDLKVGGKPVITACYAQGCLLYTSDAADE